jgi:cobalt-zinc-cadmium efflux system membrane fusion protein
MKITTIYIIAVSLFFQSCGSDKKTETAETTAPIETTISLKKAQLENINLTTSLLTERSIGNIIKANGSIDVPPESMVSISAPMGGYLKFTRLLPGMKINKGQLLAVLEDQQFIQMAQDYLSTKNKLELTKIDFKKQKELFEAKAISEKAYLDAKSNLEILSIQLQSYSEKLKLIGINPSNLSVDKISSKVEILSPINGYVSKVNVNVGKYLSPNDILFELINPDDIHLNIQIFQKDIPYLAIGQKVITYTNEHPEIKHKAEIILIGRGLNESKAIDVHCHFEKPDHDLIPGMYMNVEIESSVKKSIVVNEEAILRYENNNYLVLAINDTTFELFTVITGITEKPYVEIVNPNEKLKNSKIVVDGAYKILMAMKNKSEE